MRPEEDRDGVDLHTVDLDYLRQHFLKMEKDESGEGVATVNDSQLLRSLIWQFWLKLLARQAEPIQGNVRSLWYRHVSGFYRRHKLGRTDRPRLKLRKGRQLGWSRAAGGLEPLFVTTRHGSGCAFEDLPALLGRVPKR